MHVRLFVIDGVDVVFFIVFELHISKDAGRFIGEWHFTLLSIQIAVHLMTECVLKREFVKQTDG